MTDDDVEIRAKTAYEAYKDCEKPLNRYAWESLTERSKEPFRAIARALSALDGADRTQPVKDGEA